MLSNMLRVKGKSLHEEGPVISVEVEGTAGTPRRVFVRNPYYRGPDPMKEVLWFYNNPDGTRGFVRNPFAPGADTQKQDELRKFIEKGGVVGPSVMKR